MLIGRGIFGTQRGGNDHVVVGAHHASKFELGNCIRSTSRAASWCMHCAVGAVMMPPSMSQLHGCCCIGPKSRVSCTCGVFGVSLSTYTRLSGGLLSACAACYQLGVAGVAVSCNMFNM
jgi:hypothetical protein